MHGMAHRWLQRSAEGFCAATDPAPGDCERGDKGYWPLSGHAVSDGWLGAARACLERCGRCSRCRFVSISVRYLDCSWFNTCDVTSLHSDPSSFRSGSAHGNASTIMVGSPGAKPWSGVGRHSAELRSTIHDELDRVSQGLITDQHNHRLKVTRTLPLPLPSVQAPPGVATTVPLLLLGLVSGDAHRRRLLRCTWVGALPPEVRARFVVWADAPDAARADVLAVERGGGGGDGGSGGDGDNARARAMRTGSYDAYAKIVAFLRYAATQPEPVVAKADDDVFAVPQMLRAVASQLARLASQPGRQFVCAGSFNWFSWRRATLDSVAWSRTRAGASFSASPSLATVGHPPPAGPGAAGVRGRPQARRPCSAERPCNCSPGGGGYAWDGWELREAPPLDVDSEPRACVGPFAFSKGALKLFSAATVRWLVRSRRFADDVAHAERLAAAGALPARLSEDAQIGYWLAAQPSLHLVALLQFSAWANSFHQAGDLRHLLMVHRTPWDLYAWLLEHTHRLWSEARRLQLHVRCGAAPPCRHCAHERTQRVCALHAKLPRHGQHALVARCDRCRCTASLRNGSVLSVAESHGRCQFKDDPAVADQTIRQCNRSLSS